MDHPFELEVLVYQRPHMRDEALEYEFYMGRPHLDNLFDKEIVDTQTTHLFFSFPERWLNIVEERSLYPRIAALYPNLKKLTIKTQSVYILQCTAAKHIKIVRYEGDESLPLPQEAVTGRLWLRNVGNLLGKGLSVLC